MTPEECARAVGTPVGLFGTAWMFEAETYAEAGTLGFGIMDFYVCGRAGVAPGTTAEQAYEDLAIFGHDLVVQSWEAGQSRQPVARTAEMWAEACAAAGRRHFADADPAAVARLAELCGRVAAADDDGLPIFAAWRRLPVPDDAPGALAHQLNALREQRGGRHLLALRAIGVDPAAATYWRAGADMAALFGHSEPWPEITDELKANWHAAEAATNAAVAPAFAALDEAERDELVDLVTTLLG